MTGWLRLDEKCKIMSRNTLFHYSNVKRFVICIRQIINYLLSWTPMQKSPFHKTALPMNGQRVWNNKRIKRRTTRETCVLNIYWINILNWKLHFKCHYAFILPLLLLFVAFALKRREESFMKFCLFCKMSRLLVCKRMIY